MRTLLGLTLTVLLGCASAPPPEAVAPGPAADDPRVAVAASITFTEGPTVYKDGSVFFSEMRSNRTMRYYPEDGRYETFRADARGANGLLFDAEWRLISCEANPPRVTRMNVETGEPRCWPTAMRASACISPTM